MVNSVPWHGQKLRKNYSHVLKKALDFEVENKRKKGQRGYGRSRLKKKKHEGLFEQGRCTWPINEECLS